MTFLKSQRDIPGTQREYETIYILRPDATTDQIHDVNTRIRKVIDEAEGKLIRVDNWGKRKLAYEIRKQLKGIYLYWLYLGEATLVKEIERNLRMLDLVIRYYTVKIDETVNPDARPSLMDEESFAATATTVPDEEDAYLGRFGDHESTDEQSAEGEAAETAGATGSDSEAAAADAPLAEGEQSIEAAPPPAAVEGDEPPPAETQPAVAEETPQEAVEPTDDNEKEE